MNSTFRCSPVATKISSGRMAASGILRPNMTSGLRNELNRGKHPASTPSGTPTITANKKPRITRRSVTPVLEIMSNSSLNSSGACENVSRGLGSVSGPMIRSSTGPNVKNHQPAKHSTTQNTPSRNDSQIGPGLRSLNQSPSHWLKKPGWRGAGGVAVVSVGGGDGELMNGLARLSRKDLHFHATIERVIFRVGCIRGLVPPKALDIELVRVELEPVNDLLFHGVRTPQRQILHHVRGHLALHRAVRVTLDDNASIAKLARQLADLLDHEFGLWIVVRLDRLAILIFCN